MGACQTHNLIDPIEQHHTCHPSSRLLPCSPHANQAAHCACQTHNAIVEVDVAQRCTWHGEIAEIRDELEVGRVALPMSGQQIASWKAKAEHT